MVICPKCEKDTIGEKNFSLLWTILTCGIYLVYYWRKKPICGYCGATLK